MSFPTARDAASRVNRLQPVTLQPGEPFSFDYCGWTVTAPPPPVPGPGLYAASPSEPVSLQWTNVVWLPRQSITPAAPFSANLSMSADSPTRYGGLFWKFFREPRTAVEIYLTLPALPLAYRCNVTISLALSPCTPGSAGFDVSVNGGMLHSYVFACDNWFKHDIPIPTHLLRNGDNVIVLKPRRSHRPFWVQSVSAWSPDLPVTVSAQWEQICRGRLAPGDELDHLVLVQQGVTATVSETRSFARQLGFEVDAASIATVLSALAAHLSVRLSWDQSALHPVSLAAATSRRYGLTVGPAPETGRSFQLWQLCLVYETDGQRIVQALGETGPIIMQTYPAPID